MVMEGFNYSDKGGKVELAFPKYEQEDDQYVSKGGRGMYSQVCIIYLHGGEKNRHKDCNSDFYTHCYRK
jgi:hypothetical protein